MNTKKPAAAPTPVEPKPLCETTMTPRNPRTDCGCATYPDNLGSCDSFEEGANGRCVYCDHDRSCHPARRVNTHDLGTCLRFANGETCIGCGDEENGIILPAAQPAKGAPIPERVPERWKWLYAKPSASDVLDLHTQQILRELGTAEERIGRDEEALKQIEDEDSDCGCDCATEDCCVKVGVFCPHCIARAALAASSGTPKEKV